MKCELNEFFVVSNRKLEIVMTIPRKRRRRGFVQNHGLEENLCPNVTLVLEQRTLKLICGQDHFFGVGKDELLLFLVPNYCAFF